jgi:hypothetical protein
LTHFKFEIGSIKSSGEDFTIWNSKNLDSIQRDLGGREGGREGEGGEEMECNEDHKPLFEKLQ